MAAADKAAKSPRKKKCRLVKRLAVILGAALFIAGCVPRHYFVTDGGTTIDEAVLWGVTHVHGIASDDELGPGYKTGTPVRVLFFTVYDDVRSEPAADIQETK